MMDFQAFLNALKGSRSIALTAPAWGDGDSVGTQCAMREALLQLLPATEIRIINETPCPKRYQFLAHADVFEVSADVLKAPKETWPDAWICVDGSFERIGDLTTQLWNAGKKHGLIDHHRMSGHYNYGFRLYDPDAAATVEIVFKFLKDHKIKITPTMAQAMYLGLIFDTGLFKHSNTTPATMRMGADLLETGFDHTMTAEVGMLIRSPGSYDMLKHALGDSRFEVDARYVWGVLDHKAFLGAGGDAEDREGLIDLLFLTTKCEIAAFYFEPRPNVWKISFRSRGWDVAQLARSVHPDGGGHVRAAGCTLEGTREEVLGKCHQAIKKLLTV
jgi:phosphoesterase RecJ-like protein